MSSTPHDALSRNIADGDDRHRHQRPRKPSPSPPASPPTPHPGVVAATLGWNKLAADGNGINTLTSERLTDIAGGATFYSTLVQVTKAQRIGTSA